MKNKKTKIAILAVIALVLVTIGITYAYWLITRTQTGQNEITTGCLDISLSNEANDITLTNQFPMSDEDGMKLTPYEFTVTNNCNTSVDYHVNLEAIEAGDEIGTDSIKAVLNEESPKKLYDYVGADTTISNAYEAYTLGYGTLAASGNEGSSATYELRLWIDADAPISEMNKTFISKISVIVGQGISSQGTKLATLIMNDAETNNYLYSTTPDFNTVNADGEYGLYSAEDDYGTSYYFRGDVENNYVELGSTTTTYEAYVPSDPTDEMFASMVFNSKANCEAIGASESLWTTCTEYTGEDVYISPSGEIESELGLQGSSSPETCEGLTEETCLATPIKRGEVIEPFYWRIIRINGDGTIRLVYDGKLLVANGTAHTATIGETAYNTTSNDAKYVGYTYDDGTGTQVDSTIKSVVETWYETNLESDYGKYIADSIFCNDREIVNADGNYQYYGAYTRLDANKSPKLTCTQEADKYTVSSAKGNGLLKKPVGLMTADEIAFAGGKYTTRNSNYYLYTGTFYWSMSPFYWNGSHASAWRVSDDGRLNNLSVASDHGARPVINLKADSLFSGNGTIDNPYKIVTE